MFLSGSSANYTARAAQANAPAADPTRWRLSRAAAEIDNLRTAFAWRRDNGDLEHALRLASSLWPLWVSGGRLREGLAWFDTALSLPLWHRLLADAFATVPQLAGHHG